MIKNTYISNEHNGWCISGYTTDKETIHVTTMKLKEATIPYYSN